MIRPTSPTDPLFAQLLLESYARLVGRPLVDVAAGERAEADWLYDGAPFCLLAHDGETDPRFIYANRTAQACFEYDWDRFLTLPSRLSAEAPERAERQRLLDAVATNGFITDYKGIRIARSGRRFRVEGATVWELSDGEGRHHGQAAILRRWYDL